MAALHDKSEATTWLLPNWQCKADSPLWRAWPSSGGLWHPHGPVRLAEAPECGSRSRCQGRQHPNSHCVADGNHAPLPVLLPVAPHRQPVRSAPTRGWVGWVHRKLPAIFLLWWEVKWASKYGRAFSERWTWAGNEKGQRVFDRYPSACKDFSHACAAARQLGLPLQSRSSMMLQ